MKKKVKEKKTVELLQVEILEARKNKLFSEKQRQWVRFLRYNRTVECAECGKKRKIHWTAMTEFTAQTMEQYSMQTSGKIHKPLTPVCCNHFLGIPETSTSS